MRPLLPSLRDIIANGREEHRKGSLKEFGTPLVATLVAAPEDIPGNRGKAGVWQPWPSARTHSTTHIPPEFGRAVECVVGVWKAPTVSPSVANNATDARGRTAVLTRTNL